MLGKPKYNYGDRVKFNVNGEYKEGEIAIIDRYGTFFDDSDVSYDILNEEENMLYKHCREDCVVELIHKEDGTGASKGMFWNP